MAEQMHPGASAPTLSMSFCLRLENSHMIEWAIYICIAYLLLSRAFSIPFAAWVIEAIASRLPCSNSHCRHRAHPPQPEEPRYQHPATQTAVPLILVLHHGGLKPTVTGASSSAHPDVAAQREPAQERSTASQERTGQDHVAARAPHTTMGVGRPCGCFCDAHRVSAAVRDDGNDPQVAGPAEDEEEKEPAGDDAPGSLQPPADQGEQRRFSLQAEIVSDVVGNQLGWVLPGLQPDIVGQLFVDGTLSLDR